MATQHNDSPIPCRQALQTLQPYPAGKPIEEVQREYGLETVIKMASNENPLGPSPKAMDAVRLALTEVNRYPDANGYLLRVALSKKLNIPLEHLIIGNGSDELVLFIALTYLGPKDRIIVSDKAFIRYEMAAHVMEAQCMHVPMKDFHHDLEGMTKAVGPETRAIFFSNPNNPVGTMVERKAVEKLLDAVPPRVLIIIDEAYREYVDHPDYPDALTYLETHPNVIVLRTFSKVHGLAGLRVGYGIAHPQIIHDINRVRPPFNVNRLAQVAALAALEDEEHVQRTVQMNADQKEYLQRELTRLKIGFVPSSTNFLLIDTALDSLQVSQHLLRQGIIIRPLAGFGMPTHIRVTIGTPEQNRVFVQAFERILAKLRGLGTKGNPG
jgi:histidinol-phosphate aminotransferase